PTTPSLSPTPSRHPRSTLLPYTTLFRSVGVGAGAASSSEVNNPIRAQMPQPINAKMISKMMTATIRRRRKIWGGIFRGRGGSCWSDIDDSLATQPENPVPDASMVNMSSALTTPLDDAHIHRVRTRILDWYAANARKLPWREPDTTAWGVLVSEVMLQQTQVARVWEPW